MIHPTRLLLTLSLAALLCGGLQAQTRKPFEPKTARDFYRLGLYESDEDKFDEAIAAYDRAIQLQPDFVDAYVDRGISKFSKKDYDGAIADYMHAMQLDPERTSECYVHIGRAKKGKGDYDGAIAAFSEAIKRDPSSPFTYYDRGVAEKLKGEWDAALADFNSALQRKDRFSMAYYNRAFIYTVRGDFAKSIPDFSNTIVDQWDNARAWILRRFARQHLGQTDDLEEAKEGLKKWNPGWSKELGKFVAGQMSEDEFFKEASAGDATTVQEHQCQAFYYAGMMHLLKGETEQARALFEKCLATKKTDFDEYLLAGVELGRLKKLATTAAK